MASVAEAQAPRICSARCVRGGFSASGANSARPSAASSEASGAKYGTCRARSRESARPAARSANAASAAFIGPDEVPTKTRSLQCRQSGQQASSAAASSVATWTSSAVARSLSSLAKGA
jgi:hypothetical protein